MYDKISNVWKFLSLKNYNYFEEEKLITNLNMFQIKQSQKESMKIEQQNKENIRQKIIEIEKDELNLKALTHLEGQIPKKQFEKL